MLNASVDFIIYGQREKGGYSTMKHWLFGG